MDQQRSDRGVAIYIADRKHVVLRFDAPVQVIGMPKAAALELAQNIKEAAEMILDEQDPIQ